jgi:hypothetical protein
MDLVRDHKKVLVVQLLLSGLKIKDIAKQLEISESTIYTWLEDKEVMLIFKVLSDKIHKENFSRLTKLIELSIDSLEEIIVNGSERNKLIAINQVFNSFDKYVDITGSPYQVYR